MSMVIDTQVRSEVRQGINRVRYMMISICSPTTWRDRSRFLIELCCRNAKRFLDG